MSIHVALNHVTHYKYDRPIHLGPQVVRLRPAPHSRTRILSYSMRVEPTTHFVNWQQDPQSNYLARLVFPKVTTFFRVEVDLVAEMAVLNPFDFFLEPSAENFPFRYEPELAGRARALPAEGTGDAEFVEYLSSIDVGERPTIDFLVALNQRLQKDIAYLIRMEPGVQTPEQTLVNGSGSCRDSGWLLVQLLRHLGLAARFVSGYLIQLKRRREVARRPERHRGRLHRPARLVRGLPAGRRLDRPRPDLGPATPARATSRSPARPSPRRRRRSAARSSRARRPSSTACRCAASGNRRA